MPDTESRNPEFANVEQWPTEVAIQTMLDGQVSAVLSIKTQTAQIALAAEAAALRLSTSGRLVYIGAGTSGRVAIQDGVELGPTFGWPSDRLVYIMAGGLNALARSAEGAEDDRDASVREIAANAIGPADVVIAVAASGKTPFTIAAVDAARTRGALTIAIANNAGTPLLNAAEHPLLANTGSELIAGSTRMNAGTAQKVILNLLSTATMLRLGRVYRGLMVDMVISNSKLLHRAHGIIQTITGCPDDVAVRALEIAKHDIKQAVLIAMGQSPAAALSLLGAHRGILGDAIRMLEGHNQ